ncbi:unnamed protein product [Auanema sp. JU1783]|nr:unnamed protein product [Auanema sp. JU1783]
MEGVDNSTSDATVDSASIKSSQNALEDLSLYCPIEQLQEEHKSLNESLSLLSSQFAQIQFRLRQIVNSNGETKDDLLKELHDYAFKGVTETSVKEADNEILRKQSVLMNSMREKLEELEKKAEIDGKLNNKTIIQKQRYALEKLTEKMKLSFEFNDLSATEVDMHADEAIREFMNPFREKQELVDQLQVQIIDLERFVNILQNEVVRASENDETKTSDGYTYEYAREKKSFLESIPVFGTKKFQKNQLKNNAIYNHYGDERAHLEIAVKEYEKLLKKYTLLVIGNTDSEGEPAAEINGENIFKQSQEEIVTVVRKRLAPTLKALLEHGMRKCVNYNSSSSSFGCFNRRSLRTDHIWDIIMFFYEQNNGKDRLGAVPKLSQTFALDNIAGRSPTAKEYLLTAIEEIATTHAKLRRSKDSQWKAFVSAAINSKRLPSWIRIIFRTRIVVDQCYHTYSYVARTGCDELNDIFEHLHEYNVSVPVDLALKPFVQMKEAF